MNPNDTDEVRGPGNRTSEGDRAPQDQGQGQRGDRDRDRDRNRHGRHRRGRGRDNRGGRHDRRDHRNDGRPRGPLGPDAQPQGNQRTPGAGQGQPSGMRPGREDRNRFGRHHGGGRDFRHAGRQGRHSGGGNRRFDPSMRGDRQHHRTDRRKADVIRELEKRFDHLVAIDPNQRFMLETEKTEMTTRVVDLFGPIGRGQRAMIVAPPKAGKTLLLQKMALAINKNHPEARVICLLVDERPEEVTDFRRSVPAEVIASCSDQTVDDHVAAVEDTFLTARESVLEGKDVVVFLDSLTRLARAYNQYTESSGKTLSGGLDSAAMQRPRKFFGAARNIDRGGSLTVVATALIETGSRMDDIIFQEFKGTGNTEIVLSRKLAEQRIFPAIDLNATGTRREERLFPPDILMKVRMLRRALNPLPPIEAMMLLLDKLGKFETNEEFLKSINVS